MLRKIMSILLIISISLLPGCIGKSRPVEKPGISLNYEKVGSRGILFFFRDIGRTNVYVINGKRNVFIVDTYLGPDIMSDINKYIEKNFGEKPIIVINTHNHWDHVWGNCFYSSSPIIAHSLCMKNMKGDGLKKLEEHKGSKKGEVVYTYPNITFENRLRFEEDEVELYYTPGHTDDSISVIDLHDKVLYAGDNLEEPTPQLRQENAKQYIQTLEEYLKLDVNIVIGGHTECSDKALITKNLDYAKQFISD